MKLLSALLLFALCASQTSFASRRWNKPSVPKAQQTPGTQTAANQASEKEKSECCSDSCVNKAHCCTSVSLLVLVGCTVGLQFVYNAGYQKGGSEGFLEGNRHAHFAAYSSGYRDGVDRMVTRHKIKQPSMDRMDIDIRAGYAQYMNPQNYAQLKNDE